MLYIRWIQEEHQKLLGIIFSHKCAIKYADRLGHDVTKRLLQAGMGLQRTSLAAGAQHSSPGNRSSTIIGTPGSSSSEDMRTPLFKMSLSSPQSSSQRSIVSRQAVRSPLDASSSSPRSSTYSQVSSPVIAAGSTQGNLSNTAGGIPPNAQEADLFPDYALRQLLLDLQRAGMSQLASMRIPFPEGAACRLMGIPDPSGSLLPDEVVAITDRVLTSQDALLYRDPGERAVGVGEVV